MRQYAFSSRLSRYIHPSFDGLFEQPARSRPQKHGRGSSISSGWRSRPGTPPGRPHPPKTSCRSPGPPIGPGMPSRRGPSLSFPSSHLDREHGKAWKCAGRLARGQSRLPYPCSEEPAKQPWSHPMIGRPGLQPLIDGLRRLPATEMASAVHAGQKPGLPPHTEIRSWGARTPLHHRISKSDTNSNESSRMPCGEDW
jgi:hypothetical protein